MDRGPPRRSWNTSPGARARASALVAAIAGSVACAPDPTQIVVTVTLGDPALSQGPGGDIESVTVSAGASQDAALTDRTATLGSPGQGVRLPAPLLAVTPRDGASPAQAFVRVEGSARGRVVASNAVTLAFAPGHRRELVLPLYARCVGAAACPPGQLCGADGACVTLPGDDGGVPTDATDVSGACAPPAVFCGSGCVDVTASDANCGGCGRACAGATHCVAAACACPAGETLCTGGACVATPSDPANCGGCGHACAAGQLCASGTCTTVCAAGQTLCGGACVDTTSDVNHCGACTNSCLTRGWTGAACAGGTCVGCGDGVCSSAESAAGCAFDCRCDIRCCDGVDVSAMVTPSCNCTCQASAAGGRACENSGHCAAYRWRLADTCQVRGTGCPAGCRAADSCPDEMFSDPPTDGTCSLPALCCASSTTCVHSAACCR